MKMIHRRFFLIASLACLLTAHSAEAEQKTLNVLFIGNSYTARHNLSQVVKQMAEVGNPGLSFDVTTVIYGGRTLADHWRLGTQNVVQLSTLTKAVQETTISGLEASVAANPEDKYAKSALGRQRRLLAELGSDEPRPRWDIVVLQSYKDDLDDGARSYARYAPRFVDLVKAQGARALLYETTPLTQNARALESPPAADAVEKKAGEIAMLANQLDVVVAPMSLVAHRCQLERPDLALRFINDAHLNQTMAYLTACTIYGALFDKSPIGLPVDSITDNRYFEDSDKTRDRDGDPITRVFSEKDRTDLQRIAWEGLREFRALRGEVAGQAQ